MKKYLLLFITILTLSFDGKAQIDDNPIYILSEKLYQNEMLANRFFKNFVFIKTNTFKKKALLDMDKSLAKFDDNLSYIILHLPENKDAQENFIKLQNFWNLYRIAITNYEQKNYKSLINKTRKFNKMLVKLTSSVLHKHPKYAHHKKMMEMAQHVADNQKNIDNIAIAYVLKGGLEMEDAYNYFDISFGDLKKGLKKLGKNKTIAAKATGIVNDLRITLESIKDLYDKDGYKPKMMFSNINNYAKKSFKLLDFIINNLK